MAPFRRDPARAADPARPARRRRPTWRDPRLAGGLALIGAAVALGTWAVDAAADTQQVYILTRDVAPGQDLTADGILTLVDAHPGTDAYVLAGQLPEAAVGIRTPDDLRPIVLEVSSGLPAGTGTGDVVDLWVLPATQVTAEEARERAEVVAEHLTVSTIGDKGTSLIGKETTEVEVLVPADSVSAVLTAIGGDGALVLVPTGTGS